MKILAKKQNFIIAGLIFTAVMAVYLFTLAPSITTEDSGELITAAYTLGIPHPSGYPLFCLLGKLFTFIPLGTIAWRVNLMSAVFGALTIALLYLVIEKMIKNKSIAASCSLLLAFSPIFWSQSLIAEVYTLNTFIIILLVLLLLIWTQKRQDKYLLWFALLFGVSLTNHTSSVLFAWPFGLYILIIDGKILRRWDLILKMFFLSLLGFSLYLYLPLRAWQGTAFNWGPITDWASVLRHITRQQYNDFYPLMNKFNKLGLVVSFFLEIIQEFSLPLVLLALGGVIRLIQKKSALAILTIGIFLLNTIGVIYLRRYGWGLQIEYIYRVYYLPAFLMLIIWLAIMINYFWRFLFKFFQTKAILKLAQLFFILVLFSLPLGFLIGNYKGNDLSRYWFNYDYAKNILAGLEPNSVFYFAYDDSLAGDTELFSLVYFQILEGFRPDVSIVYEHGFFDKRYNLKLPLNYFKLDFKDRRKKIINLLQEMKDRPLYANFAVTGNDNDFGLFSLTNGYVHKIYPSLAEAKKVKPALYFRFLRGLDQVNELSDYATSGLASRHYYNLATFYLTQGDKNKSQEYLLEAIALSETPFNYEYRQFLQFRKEWQGL